MAHAPSTSVRARLLLGVAAVLAIVMQTACSTIEIELPEPFLRLDTDRIEVKATTPDDALLWIRGFEDENGGSLEFWTAALRENLQGERGLVAIGEPTAVEDGHGRPGTVQLFRARRDGQPYGYLCALFVTSDDGDDSEIRVAEFTAKQERFDELLPAVLDSLATLQD